MNINLDLIDLPERDLRASVDEDALDELAASMRDNGQLQSIGVREKPDGRYEVVFGSRRTRAARLNHWNEIRAELITETSRLSDPAAKLVENVQRLDMTPMEEAYGLSDLIGGGLIDVRELQRQTGKSRQWIKTRLDLIALPEDLQGAVQAGVLPIGVALIFGSIANDNIREQYTQAAIENGCTVEIARQWASLAEHAATGALTMDNIIADAENTKATPQVVDQQYSCFICAETHSWRRVNTLVVCGQCQDVIAATRNITPADPTPTPLATNEQNM